MKFKVSLDPDKGIRGRLIVALVDGKGKQLDHEVIIKHPFMLVFRMRLATMRINRRQRKIKRYLEALD